MACAGTTPYIPLGFTRYDQYLGISSKEHCMILSRSLFLAWILARLGGSSHRTHCVCVIESCISFVILVYILDCLVYILDCLATLRAEPPQAVAACARLKVWVEELKS